MTASIEPRATPCALVASPGGIGAAAFEKARVACAAPCLLALDAAGAQVRMGGDPRGFAQSSSGEALLASRSRGSALPDLLAAWTPAAPPGARARAAVLELLAQGAGALARLPAPFALLAWDPTAHVLGLARDADGAEPLYLAEQASPQGVESVLVAGRLGALLDAGLLRRRLDPLALASYLWRGELSGTRTVATGVRRARAGAWTTIAARDRTIRESAAAPSDAPAPAAPTAGALARELRLAIGAGAGVLVSDGPASWALALAAREARPALVHLERAGELERVRERARALALPLAVVTPGPALLDRWLERLPARLDEPGLAALEVELAAELAREAGLSAALLGSGGVERHGTRGETEERASPWGVWLPPALRSALARRALARDRARGTRSTAAHTRSPALRRHVRDALASPDLAHDLLDRERLPPLALGIARERVEELDRAVAGLDPRAAERRLALEARAEPTLLALAARAGAAEPGPELRAPWLEPGPGREDAPAFAAAEAQWGRQAGQQRHGLARALAEHLAGPRRERLLEELAARDAADALGLRAEPMRARLTDPARHPPVDPLLWLALWSLARWSAARAIRV